jgi:hypothetical protein
VRSPPRRFLTSWKRGDRIKLGSNLRSASGSRRRPPRRGTVSTRGDDTLTCLRSFLLFRRAPWNFGRKLQATEDQRSPYPSATASSGGTRPSGDAWITQTKIKPQISCAVGAKNFAPGAATLCGLRTHPGRRVLGKNRGSPLSDIGSPVTSLKTSLPRLAPGRERFNFLRYHLDILPCYDHTSF